MNFAYLSVTAFIFATVIPKIFPDLHPLVRLALLLIGGYSFWLWINQQQKFSAELQSHFEKGYAHFEQTQYRQALQEFDKILNQPPRKLKDLDGLADIYFVRGQVYYFQKRYHKAIADWNQTIALASDYADAYFYRGVTFQTLNQGKSAIADYEKAIQLDPNSFKTYYYWGILYQDEGHYELSIERYSHAIRLNPYFTEAFIARGHSYYCTSNYDQALRDYDRAVDLRGQGQTGLDYSQEELRAINLYCSRGMIHLIQENRQKALKDFNASIEQENGNAIAYLGRGTYRCYGGKYSAGLSDFRNAIGLTPSAIAFYHQAVAENALGLSEEAILSLSEALRLQENMVAALYLRGNLNLSIGDELQAEADLQNAKDLESSNPELLDKNDAQLMFERGLAFHREGESEIAKESFSQALRVCQKYEAKVFQKKIEDTLDSLSLNVPA